MNRFEINMAAAACAYAGRFVYRKTIFQQVRSVSGVRTFLSDNYKCDSAWQKRLENPVLSKLNLADYYYELDRKLVMEKKISAIDLDMFTNGVMQEDQLEELEDLVHRFRRTPNTIHTLESTHHAVVRAYLEHPKSEGLMRILNDRVNYGIFPDHYACNMMMDAYLKQENYRDAAKVAVFMMLQEDFDNPISHQLALYSCHAYLCHRKPEPWDPEAEAQEIEEEPEDDIWVRVRFIPQPYFDEHFDLREPNHLLGKTLIMLGKGQNDIASHTCQLIGTALFSKWDDAEKLLEQLISHSGYRPCILREGVEKFEKIIEEISDDEEHTRDKVKDRFASLLKPLSESGCIGEGNLKEILTGKVVAAVKAHENQDIEFIRGMYDRWVKNRQSELEKQVELFARQRRLRKIEEVKEELMSREELLFFFENIEKHRLNIPLEEEDELINEEGKVSGKSLLDIPPEIEGKTGRFSAPIIEENEPWWRWKEEREKRAPKVQPKKS